MKRSSSLVELLSAGDDRAPVFGAPETPDLSYGDLRTLIIYTVKKLNGYGIGRNDRVAIVLDGETFVGLITRTDLINHLSLNR